jgi:hypothetical protein
MIEERAQVLEVFCAFPIRAMVEAFLVSCGVYVLVEGIQLRKSPMAQVAFECPTVPGIPGCGHVLCGFIVVCK